MAAILAFAAFDLWLLAFPMEGFLLGPAAADALLYFLPAHILGLLLAGKLLPARHFPLASTLGIALTILLTLGYPWLPLPPALLLGATGSAGAFLTLKSLPLLLSSSRPLLAAALGLLLGNLLLGALPSVPLPDELKFAGIALPLLFPLLRKLPESRIDTPAEPGSYLPALFAFQCLGGLMYGKLMPDYARVAFFPGVELGCYALAALGGVVLVRGALSRPMFGGIVLAAISFALLHAGTPVSVNLGMYAMQGASGLIDLFSVALVLGAAVPLAATGTVMGVTCLGILAGKIAVLASGADDALFLGAGALLVPLVSLLLYLQRRPHSGQAAGGGALPPLPPHPGQPLVLPRELQRRLSPQERGVLEAVLAGRRFAETAEQRGLSTSSVKTYMRRIYEKTGTNCKGDLLALIERQLAEEHRAATSHLAGEDLRRRLGEEPG